jgi:hypothetical protein
LNGKLGSLLLAAAVWWLIKKEIDNPQSPIERLTLPAQVTREL